MVKEKPPDSSKLIITIIHNRSNNDQQDNGDFNKCYTETSKISRNIVIVQQTCPPVPITS